MNDLDLSVMRRNVDFLKGAPTARVVIDRDDGPEMVPLRGRRMGISAEHYLEMASEIEGLHGRLRAICSTAGGIVDGYPTQSINILQRIRELVGLERGGDGRKIALSVGQSPGK